LTLQAGRQTIAFRQSGRKVIVVSAVPASDVAIMVGIPLVAAAFVVTVAVAMMMIVTVVPAIVIVIAVVLVVAVAVALCDGDRGGKCQAYQCSDAGLEPSSKRHEDLLVSKTSG
jgi:hypothetical protein